MGKDGDGATRRRLPCKGSTSNNSRNSNNYTWPTTSVVLLVALVSLVVAGILGHGAQAQNATCVGRPDATTPCQHNATCQDDGTCACVPGYASGTCGYPELSSCECLSCVHGYMLNPNMNFSDQYGHDCVCEPGWTGLNCDLCVNADTCVPYFPDSNDVVCDRTAIVVREKTFDCILTEFSEFNTTARVHVYRPDVNSTEVTADFQLFHTVHNALREVCYCLLSDCHTEGGEKEYIYKCRQTQCYYSDMFDPFKQPVIDLIERLAGLTELTCAEPDERGLMTCTLWQEGLQGVTPQLKIECRSGECTGEPRPYVKQPVNKAAIIGSSIVVVLLVAGIIVGMYAYHLHQKRYYSFKGIDGRKIDFMELADSGIEFSNDVLLFHGVSYELDGKRLVFDVEGLALPGQVFAIIGASGAGKTTLLDILAHRVKRGIVNGTITVNGMPTDKTFARITSYVDQDPAALGTQTVREMLMTAAQLRLPEVIKLEQKKERIHSLSQELGIVHILDRRYGDIGERGISGGEKRRVQIACQLVTGPSIVFLDEPTSGLDAFNAVTVCRFLKQYATRKNRTIIMSIHQPRSDIFHEFDRLLVLGGGYTIFHGETRLAKEYFGNMGYECPTDYNPADFIMDVTMVASDKLTAMHQSYLSSDFHQRFIRERDSIMVNAGFRRSKIALPPTPLSYSSTDNASPPTHSDDDEPDADMPINETEPLLPSQFTAEIPEGYKDTYASSWFTQVSVLSSRSFADMYRYPLLLRMHLAFAVITGFIIGVVFFNLTLDFAGTQNRLGLMLFILVVLAFSSLSSIGFMSREREQFAQERASAYYRPSAFFVVKVLYDLIPLRIIPAFVLGSIVYFMTSLQFSTNLIMHFYLILILFNCITALICLCISTMTTSTSLANLMAIIALLFFMLFQNVLINLDALPPWIAWVSYLSPFRFALNSLMVNEFDGLFILFDPAGIEPELITGRMVLTLFGFKPEWAYTVDLYVLCSMLGVWLLTGLLFVYVFVRERR